MKKTLIIALALAALASAAAPALAQSNSVVVPTASQLVAGSNPAPSNLAGVIGVAIGYLNLGLVLLMAVAVIIFVWNVIKYFIISTENRKEAGNYVLYSVIGFFVILSLWGLVNILSHSFGIGNTSNQSQTWQSLSNLFPHS